MTILDKTEIRILLSNTQPDLGPPLQLIVCVNNKEIYKGELVDDLTIEETVEVIHGDNYLTIEHIERQDANTRVDAEGTVIETAMIDIKDLKINKIFFYPDNRLVDKNVFEPKYDESFIEYSRKQDNKTNFPNEVTPGRHIGIMGKQKIYFMWPLHIHAFYYAVHDRAPAKK